MIIYIKQIFIILQNDMNKLLDDKKEMELLINNLKKENASLKKKNIEELNFINWNHEEILLWILSIDDGYFDKYSNILDKELNDCEMRGKDLLELSTKDIRGLGVKVFADAKKLEKCIQELVNKYSIESKHFIVKDNEGNQPPTAYI